MSRTPVPWFDADVEGPALVRAIERQWRTEMRYRQPVMTMKRGVPDVCLFRGYGTMRNGRVATVERRVQFTDLGRYGMGVSPLRKVPCVVTTWRAAGAK